MGASRSMMLALPPSPRPSSKKVAPPPRVLLPGAQHARLRPTDNGSALLEAGTIRGSRQSQGRLSSEHDHLIRHRLFHSDPDISQGRGSSQSGCGYKDLHHDVRKSGRDYTNLRGSSEVGYINRGYGASQNGRGSSDIGQNGRDYTTNGQRLTESGRSYTNNATESGRDYSTKGGVASARKIRQKKSRAPQPPRQDVATCKCVVAKPRAPPPPGATTRTESAGPGYEKKLAPLEKWRVERPPPKFYFGQAACSSPPPPPPPASIGVRVLPRREDEWRCSSSDCEAVCPYDWTPRQDLSDDGSDDELTRPSTAAEVRFPPPAALFSNHRQKGRSLMDMGVASDSHWSSGRQEDTKGRGSVDGSHWSSSRKEGRGLVTESDPNWTFGLTKHGRRYSSELLLNSKKRSEILDNFLLGDVLASKAGQMKSSSSNFSFGAKKSSDSSNFSFYSTEGLEPPLAKGRVSEIRRRFDANLSAKGAKQEEEGRRRDMQLARMLEDEVRKRRNREKAGLREELRRLKRRLDEEDEAYFTHGGDSAPSSWHASPPPPQHTPPASAWSPSPSPPPRDDGVYQRLMDIVRREESHLHAHQRPPPSSDSSSGETPQEGSRAFLQPYSHYRPVHFQHGAGPRSGIQIS